MTPQIGIILTRSFTFFGILFLVLWQGRFISNAFIGAMCLILAVVIRRARLSLTNSGYTFSTVVANCLSIEPENQTTKNLGVFLIGLAVLVGLIKAIFPPYINGPIDLIYLFLPLFLLISGFALRFINKVTSTRIIQVLSVGGFGFILFYTGLLFILGAG